MFRGNTSRVAVMALALFVPPPLLAAALEELRSSPKKKT